MRHFPMTPFGRRRLRIVASTLVFVLISVAITNGQTDVRTRNPAASRVIAIHFHYDPLPLPGAPRCGAHPVGGPSQAFVDIANQHAPTTSIEFAVNPEYGSGTHANIHDAVALGSAEGGFDAGISLAISNGHPFGELFVAGLPFGMEPIQYMAYLYEGGGLSLQQELYDRVFDRRLVVIPIAITSAQGAGWFP